MKSKANKGKGRFSFSAFATGAKWTTTYKESDSNEYKTYEILLENDKKEVLDYTEPQVSAVKKTGTKVEFDNIFSLTAENMVFEALEPALLKEFAWFLYLCKGRNLKINVNGKPIEYEKYINIYFAPLLCKWLFNQPRTLIITAELCPLKDEGYAYYKKLKRFFNYCEYYNIKGVIHGYFSSLIEVKKINETLEIINNFIGENNVKEKK